MNESIRKDLQNQCTFNEFEILEKLIRVIETTPDKKQKDALKQIIEEDIHE